MNINGNFQSIEQITGTYLNQTNKSSNTNPSTASFEDILKSKSEQVQETTTGSLKFSKHAGERLQQRDITLTDEQMKRLEDGTKKASEKGINESLVILDQMAFIVNVKNNTVVTAMDQESTQGNIFTNIDGAVII